MDGQNANKHINGNKCVETTYIDGEPNGLYQEWYFDGNKNVEAIYVGGKLNGQYQYWHPNGINTMQYVDNVIITIQSIKDNKGRKTILPEGELTVWKACRQMGEMLLLSS